MGRTFDRLGALLIFGALACAHDAAVPRREPAGSTPAAAQSAPGAQASAPTVGSGPASQDVCEERYQKGLAACQKLVGTELEELHAGCLEEALENRNNCHAGLAPP